MPKSKNLKHKSSMQLFPKFAKRKDPFYREGTKLKLMGLTFMK